MKKVFAILFVMLFLQGCVQAPGAPFRPSEGLLYTDYKAPLTTNFNKTKRIKSEGVSSTTHVAYYILSFAIGDASLKEAMKNGDLENIMYADYEWLNVLGIFGRLKVYAYGVEKPNQD